MMAMTMDIEDDLLLKCFGIEHFIEVHNSVVVNSIFGMVVPLTCG